MIGISANESSLLATHNVRIVGDGEQSVVLSHGFGSDQSVWKYVLPYLVDDYKVILYDLMGAGTTNSEDFSFNRYSSLHAYADVLLAILDELQIERCLFVGASVSGMVGCLASIERPEVFKKLILLPPSPSCAGYLNDVGHYGGFEQRDLDQLFGDMKSNFKSWVAGFGALAVGSDLESSAVQEFSRTFYSMRPDIALSVCKTIFQSDLRATVPMVTVPVHLLQSRKDTAVPFDVANYMLQNLCGWASMDVLNAEGHLPHLSHPNEVVPVLLRCLATS